MSNAHPSQLPIDQGNGTKISDASWFCLRSQTKHEHIAAAHLKKIEGVEIFLPRIRFKRATRQKITWVTEALFPGYLFAYFHWATAARQVKYSAGVREIVHFGQYSPTISKTIIRELQEAMGSAELHTIEPNLAPGDTVQIADGTLKGLRAVVPQVMPSRERVAVLMDLLGRQTMIEVTSASIIKEGNERAAIFYPALHPST